MAANGLTAGADGRLRCAWAGSDPVMQAYHDQEWGRPVLDDRRLFEKLCLEGFQSGLSWRTILNKRPAFRAAFAGFDCVGACPLGRGRGRPPAHRRRHRPPPRQDRIRPQQRPPRRRPRPGGGLARGLRLALRARGREPARERLDHATLLTLAKTAESTALSRELKRRSWSFVGPTTVYAFMQAMGLVNDHIEGCAVRAEAEADRQRFVRPR